MEDLFSKGIRLQKDERPIVGASLRVGELADHCGWLIEDQRDLEITDGSSLEDIQEGWDARTLARQARYILDGYEGRVGIHGPYIDLTLGARDPRARALMVSRLRESLEFAAELEASHMVVHSPFPFFGSPLVAHSEKARLANDISAAHAILDEVLPEAEQANCLICVENILDTNPAPLLALARSFESKSVGLSLDTGHATITQSRGGPPPDQWVREAGELLGHVHLQDTDGHHDRHWCPGNGGVNWFSVFEALGELRSQPRLILELLDTRPESYSRAAAWLAERGLAR